MSVKYTVRQSYLVHYDYGNIMKSCFPKDLFRTPSEPLSQTWYKYRYQIWRIAFHMECSEISRWQSSGDDVRL